MTLRGHRTARDYLDSLPYFQRGMARDIHNAVYSAAIGMTDSDIQAIVQDALDRARRALSS